MPDAANRAISSSVTHDMPQKARIRAASLHVIASIVAFVLLFAVAMRLYPGGTWLDRRSVGHDFFRNFWCDVAASVGLNGEPNPGARFALAGMLILGASLGPFWFVVTDGWERRKLALAVRGLGFLSAAAVLSVPLVPSGQYGMLHAISILIAGVPGLLAAILATAGLFRETNTGEGRLLAWLGALTLGLVAVDGAIYTRSVVTGEEMTSALLPTLQKLATMALVGWMGVAGVLRIRTKTHPDT